MKTERRHELHENVLAKQLSTGYDRARPYTTLVTVAVIAAAVAYIGYTAFSGQSKERTAEAWAKYYEARDPGPLGTDDVQKRLEEVAKEYPGTVVEDWARLAGADADFRQGVSLQFRDQSASASKHLNTATAEYNRLKQTSRSSDIRQRATYRLALAHEAQGQLDKARKEYAEVKGAFQQIAERRAKELESDDIREFYDWYAKAEAPSTITPEDPGTPGHRPPFNVDGPGDSPLKLPNSIGDFTQPTESGGAKLPSILDDEPASPKSDEPADGKPPEPPAEAEEGTSTDAAPAESASEDAAKPKDAPKSDDAPKSEEK